MQMKGTHHKDKKIVVKVGTNLITHPNGRLNFAFMERLVRQVSDAVAQGYRVIVVSSGAIGAGQGKIGISKKPASMSHKQALAAVGQGILIQHFEKLFAECGLTVGQVLLTREDVADRQRYLRAKSTLETLLSYNVIPVINENDTVATEEIEFGDNDTLGALVASTIDAERLFILSDIDGLYTADPYREPDAQLIRKVYEIDASIEQLARESHSSRGTGGMKSKINAAKIATASGVEMVIANAHQDRVLSRLLEKENIGTRFFPKPKILNSKRRWIAFAEFPQGKIIVDAGAKQALLDQNKSLLPSGVIGVLENFEAGRVVSICDKSETELGRGITRYGSDAIEAIKGRNSSEIPGLIGYTAGEEVIHRDNIVLFE